MPTTSNLGDLNDQDKIQIADQILGIRELRGVYKDQRTNEEFIFEFPSARDRVRVEREIAQTIGVPVEHFNQDEYAHLRMCTYLDNILVKYPDWWTRAADCRDEALIFEIFKKFIADQENFRRRLREGKFRRSGKGQSS